MALVINGVSTGLAGTEPSLSLALFLRQHVGDKSVQLGCGSGGCGACTVAVIEPGKKVRSINSCLAPVGSLVGCAVVTAAGMGSSASGFHPVQERMAAFHASQCGFCTPGIVAALGAALHEAAAAGRQLEGADLAACIDGNLCRCTGFRPITDVCQSFAAGSDIEDLGLHTPLPCPAAAAASGSADSARLLLQPPRAAGRPCAHGEATAHNGDGIPAVLASGGKAWLAPRSLQELLEACASPPGNGGGAAAFPIRFLGGNTGAGLYHDLWPRDDPLVICLGHVEEMRRTSVTQSDLLVGAAVTISELVLELRGAAAKRGEAAGRPLAALASMLARIAGAHVRQAGTLGGNLVLARSKGLESDLATALLGWGATVLLLDTTQVQGGAQAADGHSIHVDGLPHCAEVALEVFLSGDRRLEPGQLLVAARLPLLAPEDYFWCSKLAEAHSGVHSVMNAAVRLGSGGPRVALGFSGHKGWQAGRATTAEEALSRAPLTAASLRAALEAVVADVAPAGTAECAGMAQGLLLQALAPAVREQYAAAGGCPEALERLLQVPPPNVPPPLMRGKQEFDPPPEETAPLGTPFEKDRVLLQASGEAQYTVDVAAPAGTLFAAWVTATQACAPILGVDASAALALPGVAAFLGAADLPEERNRISELLPMPPEPLLARDRAEYHSQPLGLVVAETQAAALEGAALVRVTYGAAEPPVTTVAQALERGSFHQLPGAFAGGSHAVGDAAAAIAAAPLRVGGGEVEVPGVYHMYMEPQNALAVPDEGGAIKVYSSCQDIDWVQKAVSHSLGLRHHDVEVVCRRVGGGFGGKATRALPPAVAAAVAASRLGRPVRLVQERSLDMRLNGGRCPVLAQFDVGFTREGLIQGLDLRVFMLLGAYPDVPVDAMMLVEVMGMGYALPNYSLTVKVCRANLPPTTAMRAPGDGQGAFIMETIMDCVAAACGLDAAAVRERNLAALPPPLALPVLGGGPPVHTPEPVSEDGCKNEAACQAAAEPTVRLTPTKDIPAADYTLPRLWRQLKDGCRYEQRVAAAAAFNAASPWLKRGLGMTHTRFDTSTLSKAALVSIYPDGSVILFCGGTELGQGLTTKVKQMALLELSRLLPEARRPLPPELVRIGDQSTYTLPATSFTGGSTTSEAACMAVRDACQQLAERLRPHAAGLGPDFGWGQLMAAVKEAMGPWAGCKVPLTAYGHALGGLSYSIWGAAVSEVELNVLTGERRVLRTDIMMDAGQSMNPAIDVGQAEGAFAMGLGQCLSEARRHDPATARLLTDSLWEYHPPGGAALPRELNVTLLPGSALARRRVLGAKAIGEPPLMLAASVLSALQAAARAGRAELRAVGALPASVGEPLVRLPANPESMVAALGGSARDLAAVFSG